MNPFRSVSSLLSRAAIAGLLLPAIVQAQVPNELDLRTAIEFAVENNFTIRQARERIREQEGLIVEVKSQVLPNVSLGGSYSRDASSLAGPNSSEQNWQIALQARQLLYSGGGVRAALDAQSIVRETALLDLQAVINDQLLQVRTNFYNVLLAREQIDVQEENVKLLEEQLTTARNRFEAGAVSNFDVLRAEVELANAKTPLIRARNTLRTSIDELRYSLGFDNRNPDHVDVAPEFIGSLDIVPVSFDFAAAIDAARANRPELVRLSKLVDAREAGIVIAKSDRLPTVHATAGYRVQKSFASDRFQESLDGWTVGIQSNWAIWDGRATKGRVAQAMSQKEQARLALEDATLGVEVEVRRALSALIEATELADAAGKVVEQADEALRLANARYGAGTATQLELLSAQVALTQARNNQLQANYSYNVAAASVRRSIGMTDALISQ
ncbi:TolC family protein [Synoicihabitans lomoniglobus]|uniref:TolC family protein n=1 Tax=Synoicihabitans lomoniglobus TaxID=2909285 RepID=A0AAF0CRG3_9BACT|nr:TolC family protein [Opitutaceae bacterium LMO-M01]WED66682.1 TolC family protein [Opitutaceae bacterium LMO-M01]